MKRLQTAFVLGFHGCDDAVANDLVSGKAVLVPSDKPYDWLGSGVYFWESDPQRAHEWACEKVDRGDYRKPAVVGAVIDLGECLDLLAREPVELLKAAYSDILVERHLVGQLLPENRSIGSDPDQDRVLRYRDRAVIEHLHQMLTLAQASGRAVRPFDTVRGLFGEGREIYPGAGFKEKTHVQIAVRNLACIKGVFHPR